MNFKTYINEDSVDDKLIQFFKDNPNPSDEKIHKLADELNIDPHELEAKIYSILSNFINKDSK